MLLRLELGPLKSPHRNLLKSLSGVNPCIRSFSFHLANFDHGLVLIFQAWALYWLDFSNNLRHHLFPQVAKSLLFQGKNHIYTIFAGGIFSFFHCPAPCRETSIARPFGMNLCEGPMRKRPIKLKGACRTASFWCGLFWWTSWCFSPFFLGNTLLFCHVWPSISCYVLMPYASTSYLATSWDRRYCPHRFLRRAWGRRRSACG